MGAGVVVTLDLHVLVVLMIVVQVIVVQELSMHHLLGVLIVQHLEQHVVHVHLAGVVLGIVAVLMEQLALDVIQEGVQAGIVVLSMELIVLHVMGQLV